MAVHGPTHSSLILRITKRLSSLNTARQPLRIIFMKYHLPNYYTANIVLFAFLINYSQMVSRGLNYLENGKRFAYCIPRFQFVYIKQFCEKFKLCISIQISLYRKNRRPRVLQSNNLQLSSVAYIVSISASNK